MEDELNMLWDESEEFPDWQPQQPELETQVDEPGQEQPEDLPWSQGEATPDVLAELEQLRQREMQRQFEDDLAAIKAENPAEEAVSIEELGLDFIHLCASGIEPLVAYRALYPNRAPATPPPDIGKVSATQATQSFYTKEEVAAMSQEQVLRDLDKVNQSMQFWK